MSRCCSPALLISCLLNWGAALLLDSKHRKVIYFVALILNIAMLGYYKYTGFLLGNLRALGLDVAVPAIALPAGISFFTIEGLEFMNIFTDGSREFGKYPLSVYGKGVLKFMTYVIPFALVQY